MIKQWLVTGDTHADNERFETLECEYTPEETAIIILGDSGVNFFRNKRDIRTKNELKNFGFRFYIVRGNHDCRPQDIKTMTTMYDEEVAGEVYVEPNYLSIRYLMDGAIYTINGLRTLVIGGAYSVDKYYRLAMGWTWYANEQLTPEELGTIRGKVFAEKFDLVLTHTCPYSWRPTDLFLPSVDQSKVDNFMEFALDDIRKEIEWKVWLFGHYHADRLERPGVEMMSVDIQDLNDIMARWENYYTMGQLEEWYFRKSPHFYMEENCDD